jgi:hypothetical protein
MITTSFRFPVNPLMIGIGQNDSNIVAPEKEASLITNLIL